jgi:tRNA pseudouridine65 synthase
MSDEILNVLHDDGVVLAVHKPAGLLVHRTALDAHDTRTVMSLLREQFDARLHAIHRLDKGTSGVLLLARDARAASLLGTAFMARETDKRYLAFVRGWPPAQVRVDHALRPDDAAPDAPAQAALTEFTRGDCIEVANGIDRYPASRYALVEARPFTGRRHQIRRHLKHLSHPIIGDATHGKGPHNRWWAERLGITRLWLHALSLTVPHPDGGVLRVDSPLDAGFNAHWQALRDAMREAAR